MRDEVADLKERLTKVAILPYPTCFVCCCWQCVPVLLAMGAHLEWLHGDTAVNKKCLYSPHLTCCVRSKHVALFVGEMTAGRLLALVLSCAGYTGEGSCAYASCGGQGEPQSLWKQRKGPSKQPREAWRSRRRVAGVQRCLYHSPAWTGKDVAEMYAMRSIHHVRGRSHRQLPVA